MAEKGITIKGRGHKLMVGNTNVSVDNRTGASVRAEHQSSATQPNLGNLMQALPNISVDGKDTTVMLGGTNTHYRVGPNTERSSPGNVSHQEVKTHSAMEDGTRTTTTENTVSPHATGESQDLVKVKEDHTHKFHFRKEEDGKLIQIGHCCTIVDIRVDDQVMDKMERGGELAGRCSDGTSITFTWESSEKKIKRNIKVKVLEAFDNIYHSLLAGFKKDNFQFSRKMIQDLFDEYRVHITRIFDGCVVIEVAHSSRQSVQDMESRPGPLINIFKDFVFNITGRKVEVEVSFESVQVTEPMHRSRYASSLTSEAAGRPQARADELEDDELYCRSDADKHDTLKEQGQIAQESQIKSILDRVKSISIGLQELKKEETNTQPDFDEVAEAGTLSQTPEVMGKNTVGAWIDEPISNFTSGNMTAIAAYAQTHQPGIVFHQPQRTAESQTPSTVFTGAQQQGRMEGTGRHQSDVRPTATSPGVDHTDTDPTGSKPPPHPATHEEGGVPQFVTSAGGAKPKVKGASTDKLMAIAQSAIGRDSEVDLKTIEKSAQSALEDDNSPRAQSLDTILCLDCSQSMAGDAFRQMKDITDTFINGLEDIAENHTLEENVAVVSVSGRARVVQQLTNDYSRVRDALDSLKPEGRSPLFEMLIVALAAIQGKGGVLTVNKVHRLRPRIIVITDGKLTDESQDFGPDIQSANAKVPIINLMMELGSKKHKTKPSPIVWIPVGDADTDLLTSLAKIGNGQVAEAEDIPKLIRYYQIQDSIGKIYACVRSSKDDFPNVQHAIEAVAHAIVGDVNPSDMDEIVAAVSEKLKSKNEDAKPDDFDNVYENPDLAPLGSRVMRGKDWKWEDQDLQGVGTIINHDENENWVWVLWDSGERNRYRYNLNGVFDVATVDGRHRIPESDQFLQLGVRVKRGRGWHSLNQDGVDGNIGVVIRRRGDQEVKVRWNNGDITTHRYGKDGVYELEVCDPLLNAKDPKPPHLGTEWRFPQTGRPQDTVPESPLVEEDSRPTVWRWKDGRQWRLYQDDLQVKIHQEYNRKKDGTCLVKKRDGSYRLYFKSMQEKSLEGNVRHDVQRHPLADGELANLKAAESLQQ
ncbi:uncharacterized protein [Haliotis cracherodii]|uniref:uncharacterized protein isoform X1 n=1 Tax=Haliotis cracherodii TaxID=6455 RepID=UPI0039E7A2A7